MSGPRGEGHIGGVVKVAAGNDGARAASVRRRCDKPPAARDEIWSARIEVLPILERSPELKYAIPSSSACFGEWGNGNTHGGWEGVILENNGFAISSPFSGRVDKTTLNSNAEGSSVVLGCPPEYPFVRIAWVEHSWGNETVTASLASVSDAGGKAQKAVGINTFSPPQTSLPFRLLKFSGVHTPPVVVTLLKKRAPGAFLEIASVACSE